MPRELCASVEMITSLACCSFTSVGTSEMAFLCTAAVTIVLRRDKARDEARISNKERVISQPSYKLSRGPRRDPRRDPRRGPRRPPRPTACMCAKCLIPWRTPADSDSSRGGRGGRGGGRDGGGGGSDRDGRGGGGGRCSRHAVAAVASVATGGAGTAAGTAGTAASCATASECIPDKVAERLVFYILWIRAWCRAGSLSVACQTRCLPALVCTFMLRIDNPLSNSCRT